MFSPRIRLNPLSALCQRLATMTAAGLDDRRIWRDEAGRGAAAEQRAAAAVSGAIERGDSLQAALARTGEFYPDLFRQAVAVGEVGGGLERTYQRLAEHYQQMLALRRDMLAALSWPLVQLAMALGVVVLLIWATATLNLKDLNGQPLDMLGLGLQGTRGLAILAWLVCVAGVAVLLTVESFRRQLPWTRRLVGLARKLPGVGSAIETLSVAQFAWSLEVLLDAGLDIRRALPLALDATNDEEFCRQAAPVTRLINQGMSFHQALAERGVFPGELIDAVAQGELTGLLVESLQRLAQEYQRRAAAALALLVQLLGYAIWLGVIVLVVVMIFRIFSFYVGTIESLTK